MRLQNLFTEERAVSPVIGVILMVAITVILAAVIGAFVLGLGDQVTESAPTAQISFEYDSSEPQSVTLIHDGGSSFQADRVSLLGTEEYDLDGWEGTVSAGESTDGIELNEDSGNTLRLVWEGSGGSSSVIARSTVPSGFSFSE